jgi:hypothetical protein
LPGERLTLTYEITNAGPVPVPAVLGASILPGSGTKAVDDTANDETVSVQPGHGTYRRVFRVPLDAAPGRYDVWWGLFGTDREHFDLKKAQGVLVVSSPAPPPAPTFAPAPAPNPTSPASVVRQFYVLVGNRNFGAAWDMFSPQLQRSLDYSRWVSAFNATRSVDVFSSSVVSQSAGSATVSVNFRSVDVDAGGRAIPKTWQGTWDLVFSGGVWRMQNPNIKQLS